MKRDRIEELLNKGREKLSNHDVVKVSLTYCPVCDEEEWEVFDGSDIEYENELSCWKEEHIEYYFYQTFCDYHKEAEDLEVIIKYLEIREKIGDEK